ncbi:MAG: hypothetical protein JXR73_22510 [Candidatus Omnitrophica bacterium]|nr:hypothetical protein [Candidatus Omnitrophota bacterium]
MRDIVNRMIGASAEGEIGCNFTDDLIDLSDEKYASLKTWMNEQGYEPPCVLLRFPPHLRIPGIIESGPLTEKYVRSMVESPARREIAERLLNGDAAVWIFLESGDKERDDETLTFIHGWLDQLEKELKLPDLSDVTMADTIAMDESAPPMQIQFSTIRVSRTDPAEQTLVNILMHSEIDLFDYENQPMLFPVFGRARILYALIGEGITKENVREAAEFLIGPCSCLVKDLNPGTDLLMPVNWDDQLQNFLVQDRHIPLPFGLAEADSAQETRQEPIVASSIASSTQSLTESTSHLFRNIILGFIVILLANAVFLIFYLRRSKN